MLGHQPSQVKTRGVARRRENLLPIRFAQPPRAELDSPFGAHLTNRYLSELGNTPHL